jgi:hypothetical protein
MRWNHFDNDHVRAAALGDILLGAAYASGPLNDTKLAVVHGQIAKALGVTLLPRRVLEHLERFDPTSTDIGAACHTLRMGASPRERAALVRAIALVIRAEDKVSRDARSYAMRIATLVRMPWNAALDVVGLPSRPHSGPRPRPTAIFAAVAPRRIAS